MKEIYMERIPRINKISMELVSDKLMNHLQSYVELCLEMGASDARIVTQKDLFLDPRARMKCQQPKCMHFGTCANCPPHVPHIDELSRAIKLYSYGVIYRCKLKLSENTPADRQYVSSIVTAVENAAFYDGYYFAMGFGAGTCKKTWCPDIPCQVLQGKGCRFPLKSRMSMEAAGFDVFKTVANLGWDIYPIGRNCPDDKVPFVSRIGLILIA